MNSAKLKRKLGDLGVDTSSKRANENFCLIGTPLPPLEKSKDTGEFVPLWKQEVRDEKGRRRLHGAFTGGFSAGYFNTVGSKEGWTPSTFVSSRSDRAKSRTVRPEDFMDEEDLAEVRADQKLVSEHDEMDILGGTEAERARKTGVDDSQKDPITLALEQAMLPGPKDSVGGRILKKMGWRPGQGIGPRVTWRQREIQHGRDPDRSGPDVDEEAKKHTYAPKDTPPIVVPRKDDFHGLGYNRSLGLNASLGANEQGTQGAQGPRLAGGFGLGALNDADEDDLDVYDHTMGHGRSRHAFDASDMHDEERVVIGGRGTKSSSTTGTWRVHVLQTQANGPGVFRDGKPVLPGFKLSAKPVAEDMWFPLPEVPKGWKPNPKALWELGRATLGEKENIPHFPVPGQPQAHAQWKIGISPDQRGAVLGETPLPSAPRSVFEYMSKKDQERIKNITANRLAGSSTTDTAEREPTPPSSTLPSQGPYIPRTEPHVAQAALQGFKPFTSNPNKQFRYTAYLHAHAEPGSGVSIPARLPTQTPETYALEMSEFAKAAALFRPVSGAMAGRFTSAAVVELGPKIVEGLHTPSAVQPSTETEQKPIVEEEEKKEEEPKVHAARLGMYGPMTREVKSWQPARLLCKRFGVKDPDPEIHFDTPEASTSAAADVSRSTEVPTGDAGDIGTGDAADVQPSRGKRDLANIGLGEDDGQGDDILTYERPPMNIFKAIFASDDEESEDEKEDKVPEDDVAEVSIPSQPSTSLRTTEKPVETAETATDGAKERVAMDEKVDLSTFKPTFVPRDLQSHSGNGKAPAAREKKSKKSKTGALVSFDVDEDGGESLSILARRETKERDRPKKKRKKRREGVEEVWVEKPPPDIIRNLPAGRPQDDQETIEVDDAEGVVGPPRGRKRAVDFL
ncbi:hypothetical protein J3R83DRAFT_8571 [Lanmaoa asiatica]|nr:hypothetical protein J3R83DRAFT_8571 [Lanmaoa asiatica]